MKILHINSYYNGSKFYKNLYDKQVKNGFDIDVFVPIKNSNKKSSKNFGEYTTLSPSYSSYDRLFFHIKQNKIYKNLVSRFNIKKYNLLHAHSLFSNGYIAYRLNKKYNIPYIVAVRDTDLNIFFKKMIHLRKLGLNIMKKAEKIIFLSPSYRDATLKKYVPSEIKEDIMKKICVIPNGLDEYWLNNKSIKNNKDLMNNINILCIGKIFKRKNFMTTAKACNYLISEGYNIKFTIVGKVLDKTLYRKLIQMNFIDYISPKPKEELINIYRNNDIFVMPSLTETFGIVYPEAMSQGLPIVYSEGQGFDGQFEEGTVGFHVKSNNIHDIKDKIIRILNNYEEISNNCVKNSKKFNWESINKDYIKMYKKIEQKR